MEVKSRNSADAADKKTCGAENPGKRGGIFVEKKTPLYETHVKYNGKMVPFAGYLLPVQYDTGVIGEHMAVREACGLFDVSHMGEILCRGKDALANLNYLLTNDYTEMYDGQARYSPMCNEQGGVVDDLIVYKVQEEHYFIVVNAANREKDFAWMKGHAFGDVTFTDISDSTAQIALQGPKALEILKKLVREEEIPEKYYSARFNGRIREISCIISRTGYTGEDGFEFYVPAQNASALWELLMEAGKEEGLVCCGLGARDTLRLEASMPLYGHELNDERTPLEAGLQPFVKRQKKDFIGKSAMEEKGDPKMKRVGLKAVGRGILREQQEVWDQEKKIGFITSGTFCPYLKQAVAMAVVPAEYSAAGRKVQADVRGRKVDALVVDLPFYKRKKK